jgi:menaquinone-dependent protoporphyrinogen IX oxidase
MRAEADAPDAARILLGLSQKDMLVAATTWLPRHLSPELGSATRSLLENKDPVVQTAAISGLISQWDDDAKVRSQVGKLLTSSTSAVRGRAAEYLCWMGEPEDFLKRFREELAGKKVALFVSCGIAAPKPAQTPEQVAAARKQYLDDKATQYGLTPIALGFFGPAYDYNNMPWWASMFMNSAKKDLLSTGARETKPGFYDARDWDAIRAWAKDLATKTR